MCNCRSIVGFLVLLAVGSIAAAQMVDPTRPLGQGTATIGNQSNSDGGLKLTSILISADRKVAIINGEILQEHQTLKGTSISVKQILEGEVKLQQGTKEWSLKFYTATVRKNGS